MRTFTKTLMAFAFIGFLMTSCGGGSEICSCADLTVTALKEGIAAGKDKEKLEALKKKYEPKMEKCEKLRGKSEEEIKKFDEEMKKCPSAKEVEKLMEELMKIQLEDGFKPE